MKKLFFFIISLLVAVNLFIIYNIFHTIPMVTIQSHSFYLEVAKTQKEKEIGLAKHTTFPENKAMYFPFDHPDYYSFWMKGMHFPIDIIFVRNKKIVCIFPSVWPIAGETNLPTYKPTSPADGVLEITAGLSEKYGFKVGDKVSLSN